MNLKSIALTALLASCAPAYAGEFVENDRYELPDYSNPAVHVICQDLESLTAMLDTLQQRIQEYAVRGKHPDGCSVFVPQPLILPAHELVGLYVTDDNRLFGVIKAQYSEDGFFWAYIEGNLLVTPKSNI